MGNTIQVQNKVAPKGSSMAISQKDILPLAEPEFVKSSHSLVYKLDLSSMHIREWNTEHPYEALGPIIFPSEQTLVELYNKDKKEQEELYLESHDYYVSKNRFFAKSLGLYVTMKNGFFPYSNFENVHFLPLVGPDSENNYDTKRTCDFSYSNLESSSFKNLQIRVDMVTLNFNHCTMPSVNFENAQFINCSFVNAILPNSNFTEARSFLNGRVNFRGANLENSLFYGTRICGNFTGANLKGSQFVSVSDKTGQVHWPLWESFNSADLSKTYISGHFFSSSLCDFKNITLNKACLIDIDSKQLSTLIFKQAEFNFVYVDKTTLIRLEINKEVITNTYPYHDYFKLIKSPSTKNQFIIEPIEIDTSQPIDQSIREALGKSERIKDHFKFFSVKPKLYRDTKVTDFIWGLYTNPIDTTPIEVLMMLPAKPNLDKMAEEDVSIKFV